MISFLQMKKTFANSCFHVKGLSGFTIKKIPATTKNGTQTHNQKKINK